MTFKLLALVLVLATTACDQAKPEQSNSPQLELKPKANSMAEARTGYTSDNYKNVLYNYTFNPVDHLEISEFLQDKGLLPSRYLNKEMTWQEMDKAAKKVIQEKADDPNSGVYQQYCAISLFTDTDLLSENSLEAQKVVAYYLDILFKLKSESIGIYYYALRNAKPILSETYINQVTDFAIACTKKSLVEKKKTLSKLSQDAKNQQNKLEKDRTDGSIEVVSYMIESDETFIGKIASMKI